MKSMHSQEVDSLKTFLVQESVGNFALRIVSLGFTFLISIFLARLLGTQGYGEFTYAFAWVFLLVALAVMGFDKLLIRYISVYRSKQQWGLMRGIIRRSQQAVLIISLFVMVIAAITGLLVSGFEKSGLLVAFLLALLMLPVYALVRVKQTSMQGLNFVVRSQVPEIVFQPILFILLIGVTYVMRGMTLSAPLAVIDFVIATIFTLLVLSYMFHRVIPDEVRSMTPSYDTGLWIKTALPLLLIDSMYIINSRTDVIMLGAMKGAVSAGIYNVANRGAELIIFVLNSINMVLAPTIAALYTQGDKERLQNIITLSVRIVLLFSLPVALGLVFFGKYFLMIFGNEFVLGNKALTILSIAQLFNCAMGSVGLLLIMTGHQRQAAIGVVISAVLNVIFNALFIPIWGIEGAAIATGISIISWNSIYVVWVYRKLGIYTTALGKISLWKKN